MQNFTVATEDKSNIAALIRSPFRRVFCGFIGCIEKRRGTLRLKLRKPLNTHKRRYIEKIPYNTIPKKDNTPSSATKAVFKNGCNCNKGQIII